MKSVFDRISYSSVLYISILAFPILFMSVPRTTTALSTVLAVFCIISLVKNKASILSSSNQQLVTLAFCVYPIAIIFTQLSLNKFILSDFQQQGRILLLLPLFYYIYYQKIDLTTLAKYCIPFTCIFGAISSLYIFKGAIHWGGRNTVQHIDPLNFGFLMLFLAFSSLLIAIRWKINRWHQILCGIAFIIGIYMSIKSGSRTGWLAVPIVSLWLYYSTFGKLKFYPLLAVLGFVFLSVTSLYFSVDYVHARVNDIANGFVIYSWNENPTVNDTSAGIRISMLRMGWHAFTEAPWFGFGSENIYNIINTDSIRNYATESTIKFSSDGFMHNEFVTQLVKHGIFGGLAYLFILYTIVRIFIKSIRLKIKSPMIDVFVIYILFAVVASLSTEILIVKPMILFFGFMLACFAGEALWRIRDAEETAETLTSGSSRVV